MILEKELKILNINSEKIIKKLMKFWAEKTFDGDIHDTYYDFDDIALDKIKMSLRIRNKAECNLYTIKKKIPDEKIKICTEIEHPIECLETYKWRLDKHWLVINREKKKHRKSYKIWEIVFDIDFYEKYPPLLEIEAHNESEIFDWVKKLKLQNHVHKKCGYRGLVRYYDKLEKENKKLLKK